MYEFNYISRRTGQHPQLQYVHSHCIDKCRILDRIPNVHHAVRDVDIAHYKQLGVYFQSHGLDYSFGFISVPAVPVVTEPLDNLDLVEEG